MGTSLAFKITASVVKPTRETLLDYCSYVILVLSLIAVGKVWISGGSSMEDCAIEPYPGMDDYYPEKPDNPQDKNLFTVVPANRTALSPNSSEDDGNFKVQTDPYLNTTNVSDSHVEGWLTTVTESPIVKTTSLPYAAVTTHGKGALDSCPKYYQATFAYVLLVEALIQLFLGLLWAKVPKVSLTLSRFMEIIRECQSCDWAKKALNIITDKSNITDVSQSLYSLMSAESVNHDMRSFLDTLFHPDNDYQAKSKARHLYETVQTFSETHSEQNEIWATYVIKSIIQFVWWILIFTVNLVLFVMLEFYVICPDDINVPCNHDTFLRIIWFMAESMLFVYGMFVCKTLKWVNEKSVVRRSICTGFTTRCCPGGTRYGSADTGPLLKCRAYRFVSHLPVYNDMAVMLYLLEEAHPKVVPYYIIFMFDEWKEKLTSFPDPGTSPGYTVSSPIQMLSGRPPPIIEITEIPMPNAGPAAPPETSVQLVKEETRKQKRKPSVTFLLENDLDGSGTRKNDNKRENDARASASSSDNTRFFRSDNMVHLLPPKASPCMGRHEHRQPTMKYDRGSPKRSYVPNEQSRDECTQNVKPPTDFDQSGVEPDAETDALVTPGSSSVSKDSLAKEKSLSCRDSDSDTASETQRLLDT